MKQWVIWGACLFATAACAGEPESEDPAESTEDAVTVDEGTLMTECRPKGFFFTSPRAVASLDLKTMRYSMMHQVQPTGPKSERHKENKFELVNGKEKWSAPKEENLLEDFSERGIKVWHPLPPKAQEFLKKQSGHLTSWKVTFVMGNGPDYWCSVKFRAKD